MVDFMTKDFLLESETAKTLFHKYAKDMPILDFHCHLSPQQIYENKPLNDIGEAWLAGDHYKWRIMRACGIDEDYITGNKSYREKFKAFAKALQQAVGNPLYHWSHLELQRFFGIYEPLTEENADRIFDEASKKFAEKDYYPRGLIENSNVMGVFTTDDPADNLEWHEKLAKDESFKPLVYPAFRPDKAVNIENDGFANYIKVLGASENTEIKTVEELKAVLQKRIAYFAEHNCRASDHGLRSIYFREADEAEVERIFAKALAGETLTLDEIAAYQTSIMVFLGREYHKRDWAMEIHIQCVRNNNQRMFEKLGPDVGCDSVLDLPMADHLNQFLNKLNYTDELPKTILFTLNDADLLVMSSAMGNFQQGPAFGKLQLGTAWWMLDHYDGMEKQIRTLAFNGVLGTFVGMLTDSRSLLSYPRHEYFRRILCNVIGDWVERGMYPNHEAFLGEMVQNICLNNALKYFNLK